MRSKSIISILHTFIAMLIISAGCGPSAIQEANAESVPATYFGMHIHRADSITPWPAVSFGTWRLWDASVAWPSLEPLKGKWDFRRLDADVALAEAHNVELLLPLAFSPAWASARPTEPSAYSAGFAAEPANIEDWKNYIRTVAMRYKGRIHYYEIWNEPNLKGFFTGTVDQMLVLAREAYNILKEVDPTIKVVSPSATADAGADWLQQYLSLGGGNYADIIGYHFYVFPAAPEAMVPLINKVKKLMLISSITTKPLWNTETGWAKPKIFSSDKEEAAYIARSFILNLAAGVNRLFWYAWDNQGWVTLSLTQTDSTTLTPAGIAYGEIQKWLIGAKMESCGSNNQGTWIAQITRDGGYTAWIVWNPDNSLLFNIPKEWSIKQMRDLLGTKTAMIGVNQVNIDMEPILLGNVVTP